VSKTRQTTGVPTPQDCAKVGSRIAAAWNSRAGYFSPEWHFGLKEGSFTASAWKVATSPLGLELPWQVQRWQMLW
jgi:hypothetical protein